MIFKKIVVKNFREKIRKLPFLFFNKILMMNDVSKKPRK